MNGQEIPSFGEKEHQDAIIRWKDRLQAWKESGMTQKAWCHENHVSLTGFSIWKRRIKEEQKTRIKEIVDISFDIDNQPSRPQEATYPWTGTIEATIEFSWARVHV